MKDFSRQVQDYIQGTPYSECPHPLNRIQAVNDWQDICSLCGETVYAASFHEVPATHGTRATSADVDRMWKRLWGEMPMPAHGTSADFRECLFSFEVFIDRERGIRLAEFLDLCEGLQINQKG